MADFGVDAIVVGGLVAGTDVLGTEVLGSRGEVVALGAAVVGVDVVVATALVVVDAFPGSELTLRVVPPGFVVVVPFEPELTTVLVVPGSFPRPGVVVVTGVVVVELAVLGAVFGVVGTAPGRSGVTVLVVVVVGRGRGRTGKSITAVVVVVVGWVVVGWVGRVTAGSVRRGLVVGGDLLVGGSVSVGSSGSVVVVLRGARVGGVIGATVGALLGAMIDVVVGVVGLVVVVEVVAALVVAGVVLSADEVRMGEVGDELEVGAVVLGVFVGVLAGAIVELERPEVVTLSMVVVVELVVVGGFVGGTVRGGAVSVTTESPPPRTPPPVVPSPVPRALVTTEPSGRTTISPSEPPGLIQIRCSSTVTSIGPLPGIAMVCMVWP